MLLDELKKFEGKGMLDQVEDYESESVSYSDGTVQRVDPPFIVNQRSDSIMDMMQEAIDQELFGRKVSHDSRMETKSDSRMETTSNT